MRENVMGTVEAVEENWVVVSSAGSKAGGTEIVNIDHISHIREHPKNKKGKKKAIVT